MSAVNRLLYVLRRLGHAPKSPGRTSTFRRPSGDPDIQFDAEDFVRWLDENNLVSPESEESILSLVSWYVVDRAEERK